MRKTELKTIDMGLTGFFRYLPGKSIYTELIRDGQRVEYFGKDDVYDYNLPIEHL